MIVRWFRGRTGVDECGQLHSVLGAARDVPSSEFPPALIEANRQTIERMRTQGKPK